MSAGVTLLVLAAALLHACWNALIKSGGDKTLDTVLIAAGSAMIAAPAVVFLPLPLAESWPYLCASVAIHMLYFTALAGAYKAGDLGQAYTLMRGSAPLLVALFGTLVLDERLTPAMWLGIALISIGVIASGWLGRERSRAANRALTWAIANAFIIMAYTLVDGAGVRLSGNAAAYTLWIFFLEAIPLVGFILATRPRAALAHAAKHWTRALVGGAFLLGAYGIALWAMTRAPVAAVSALRETSVIFAAIIGAAFLNERFGAWRIGMAAVVALGTVALRY